THRTSQRSASTSTNAGRAWPSTASTNLSNSWSISTAATTSCRTRCVRRCLSGSSRSKPRSSSARGKGTPGTPRWPDAPSLRGLRKSGDHVTLGCGDERACIAGPRPCPGDALGLAAAPAAEVTDAAPGWIRGCRRRAPARAKCRHLADGDPVGMVTGTGYRSRGERTSKLSPAAWLYVAAVVAAAVAVLAQPLGADPDLDRP